MYFKKALSFLICTAVLLATMLSPLSITSTPEVDETLVTETVELPDVKAAGSGTCGGNLRWQIAWVNEVTLTIAGTGSMTDYSSSSRAPWYESRNNITKIVIENGVGSIGDYAFYGLSNVKTVSMPITLKSIGEWSFYNCDSLSAISIGKNVATISDYAFHSCDGLQSITVSSDNTYYSSDTNSVLFNKDKTTLIQYPAGALRTAYTIPDTVTHIDDFAFAQAKYLSELTLGAGVSTLGEDVFFESLSLSNIAANSANANFSSDENGVLFDKNKTTLVQYPIGNERTSYTVPSGVKNIGYCAFAGCENLTSLTISDGVESIYKGAFESCVNLADVTMPDSVKNVGYDAFMDTPYVNEMEYATNCGNYYEIYVDNLLLYVVDAGVTSGSYKVTVKDNTSGIAFGAFEYSYASEVILPDGFTHVGAGAFAYCDTLLTADIHDGVQSIGESAFEYCMNLTEVTIGSGVNSVSYGAFYGCESLDAIKVDSANAYYTSDAYGALFNKAKTSLVQYPVGNERTSYTIPDGVQTIGVGAFCGAVNLSSVDIPESVTSIGWSAFDICYSLSDIYFGGSESQWSAVEIDEYNDAVLNADITYGKEDPKVCGISISTMPEKTKYTCGQALVIDGLSVIAIYTDNSTVEVSEYTVSGFDPYTLGVQTVTVSYLEFSEQFEVYVYANVDEVSGFTSKITAGTTVADFKASYSQNEIYVFDVSGVEMISDDQIVKTGYVVVIVADGASAETVLLIVNGDGNGDGIVNGKDLIRVKKQILEGDAVQYTEYVDYNSDGIVDDSDAEYLVSLI